MRAGVSLDAKSSLLIIASFFFFLSRIIVMEISKVFKVYGISVSDRHVGLLADYMTFSVRAACLVPSIPGGALSNPGFARRRVATSR